MEGGDRIDEGPRGVDGGLAPGVVAHVRSDAEGTIVSAVAREGSAFGWSEPELVAGRARQLIHPDDRDLVATVHERALRGEGDQLVEVRVRARNGRWIWVACEIRVAPATAGRPEPGTTATLRDVSRKYLDREVIAYLGDLFLLLDAAHDLEEGWQMVMASLARVADCAGARVWEPAGGDGPAVVAAHAWGAAAEEEPPAPVVTAAAEVLATGRVLGPSGERGRGEPVDALLLPVAYDGTVEAVVELPVARPEGAQDAALLAEVAWHLGEGIARRRSEDARYRAEMELRLTFEEASIGMALVHPDGSFLRANRALCEFLGRSEEDLRRLGFQAVTHADDLDADLEHVRQVLDGEQRSYQLEKRFLRPDGSAVWSLLSVSLVRDVRGRPVHFISQVQDIDAEKRAEREQQQAVARYRAVFDGSAVGMALIEVGGRSAGRVVEANEALATMCRTTRDALVGGSLTALVHDADRAPLAEAVDALGRPGPRPAASEHRLARADEERWVQVVGRRVDYEEGTVRYAVVQLEDVTDRRLAEARLRYAAQHDALTGLPNRALVVDRIEAARVRSARTGDPFGLLFVDLDGFKPVNDSLGHEAGDTLLGTVADRLRSVLRSTDLAARVGGDEFVVLCEQLPGEAAEAPLHLERIARRVLAALAPPVALGASTVAVSASIGIRPASGDDAVDVLLRDADRSMYEAKARGPGRWAVHGGDPTT